MPWKNGQGTTTEILIHPPGASLDAFVYRLSLADLGASGPFSAFAGHDRILVQSEGEPMTLSHEGQGDHPLVLLVPHRFPGEWTTHARLSPPARDLNLMVRRDEASADLSVHRLGPGETAAARGEPETRGAFVLRGQATVTLDDETHEVHEGETLLGPDTAVLTATATATGGATVVLLAIGPPGRHPAPG
jgi:hypothetical protein